MSQEETDTLTTGPTTSFSHRKRKFKQKSLYGQSHMIKNRAPASSTVACVIVDKFMHFYCCFPFVNALMPNTESLAALLLF